MRTRQLRTPAELSPDTPASEAVRGVLRTSRAAWLAELDSLREGGDPERLHDARVALRRTRSLLRQMRAVLPAASTKTLARELRWLGLETSAPRDADVLLEELERRTARWPGPMRRAAGELALLLREERARKHERLRATLDGARHRALEAAWERFVAPRARPRSGAGAAPIGPVAAKRIEALHERLLEHAGELGPDSPPDEIHELRIACKNLRYLIDAFRGLFPADEAAAVLEAVRRFQSALGSAHDAHVWSEALARLSERAHAGVRAIPAALIAAGRLIEAFERQRTASTREFFERLRGYGSGPGRAAVARWAAGAERHARRPKRAS